MWVFTFPVFFLNPAIVLDMFVKNCMSIAMSFIPLVCVSVFVSVLCWVFFLFCFAFQDLFIFMCMNVFPACMSVYHMQAVPQKRASDPLELELQTVMSPQGTENQTQFICKAPQVL